MNSYQVQAYSSKVRTTTGSSVNTTNIINDREGGAEEVPFSEVAFLPSANKGFSTQGVYVNGILWGGNYWNTGPAHQIDYSFWNSGTGSWDNAYGDDAQNPYNWFAGEKAAMVNALTRWSNVANIQFVNAGDNNINSTLAFYNLDNTDMPFGALGMFHPPGTTGMGIGYFNWQGTGWETDGNEQGDYGFITMIHELGHGLGLAHPHDNGGGSPIYPGVTGSGSIGTYGLNQGVYTTMSYNDGLVSNPDNWQFGYQGTPMAFDIAAIQYLYGANWSYQTGNNTYSLPTVNASGTFYSCIWDAGGVDKISGAGASAGVTVNLNDASFNAAVDGAGAGGYISSASGIFGGFTIANGVIIENADGSGFNDRITGNEFNNIINAGAGNDTVDGGAGNDLIYLGDGNDYLNVSSLGNDTFSGGNGNDYIYGYTGNEVYYGEAGNDTLLGYSGNDLINGGVGADSLDGGAGTDTLSYATSTAAVTVNLTTNTASRGDATGDVIVANTFENLTGSNYNDVLNSSSANNTIYGNAGNDTVDGGAGNDLIYLGDGNDYLNVSSLGNDTFSGGNGNDYIYGYTGNEVYYGEAGNDTLLGYSGNDQLYGGLGTDSLSGGAGSDQFRYFSPSESPVGVTRDILTDFTHLVDKIDLSAIDANTTLAGNQAFEFRGTLGFNGSGDVNYFIIGTNVIVQAQIEGDGNLIADMQIQLNGVAAISAADFIL